MRLNLYIHAVAYELSPILQRDETDLIQIMADEETRRFLQQLCDLLDEINGFSILIHSFEKYMSEGTGFLLGIRYNGDLIGFIAVMDIPICPSIFYAMHPKYRRKGIMKACVMKVLDYLSTNHMCSFVQTYVYSYNYASISLLTELGFSHKGRTEENGMEIYVQMIGLEK